MPLLGHEGPSSLNLDLQAVSVKKDATIVIATLEIGGRVPLESLSGVIHRFGFLSNRRG